jgi:hypothetical protein
MPALFEFFENGTTEKVDKPKTEDTTVYSGLQLQQKADLTKILEKKKILDKYISDPVTVSNSLAADLSSAALVLGEYVKSGGVSNVVVKPNSDNSPAANAKSTIDGPINTIKGKYELYQTTVYQPLLELRKKIMNSVNVADYASKVTEKVTSINQMKDELKKEKDNLSTAFTRDAMVETKDYAVSYHQTWGMLERPLRKQSIPFMIVISIVFFLGTGLGVYKLKSMSDIAEAGVSDTGVVATVQSVGFQAVSSVVSVFKFFASLLPFGFLGKLIT